MQITTFALLTFTLLSTSLAGGVRPAGSGARPGIPPKAAPAKELLGTYNGECLMSDGQTSAYGICIASDQGPAAKSQQGKAEYQWGCDPQWRCREKGNPCKIRKYKDRATGLVSLNARCY
ncbi:hypothetical protein BDV26DRAFT_288509 [Aspergillus bertholletiae]|uniref:Uncharacterized protein n=1 Tax=Aspergillus bertholletiae TaxID=1226010 RepID=A0A5N7BL44_9EURO|nr:hypothetical protein BDV26DRAFT_288509 [Aspergillus bertholletiae]